MTIPERIFLLLKEKQIKQLEFAKYLNLQTSTVSQWKTNNITPNAEFLIKIAMFLEVSLDYLMTGKEYIANNSNTINNGIDNIVCNNNNTLFAQTQNQAPLGELEEEILNLCKKMSIKQKMELLQTAYSILER